MDIRTITLSNDDDLSAIPDTGIIIAYDDSAPGDACAHQRNIARLESYIKAFPATFYAKGNINKLEDVKKFLYAGAQKVIIEGNPTLAKEAAARFGNDRVIESEDDISTFKPSFSFNDLKTDSNGLVPVVVQEYRDGSVLMVAYMDKEAFDATISTGRMTYHSRSRGRLWVKGATSGHFQYLKKLMIDCDNDTLLAYVAQVGPACHTGNISCFYRTIAGDTPEIKNPADVLKDVYGTIEERRLNPKEGSYTNYLFDSGIDKILKKVGEEAAEVIIAAKNRESGELKYEICDLLYHMMVLMAQKEVTWDDIFNELSRRKMQN